VVFKNKPDESKINNSKPLFALCRSKVTHRDTRRKTNSSPKTNNNYNNGNGKV